MSIALYQLRLYWDGQQGAVRNGDEMRVLAEKPVLVGAAHADRLEEIDYAPEVDVAQVREHAGEWREMTPDELAAAEALVASVPTRPYWSGMRAA